MKVRVVPIYESNEMVISKVVQDDGRVSIRLYRKPDNKEDDEDPEFSVDIFAERDRSLAILTWGYVTLIDSAGALFLLSEKTRRKWLRTSASAKKPK